MNDRIIDVPDFCGGKLRLIPDPVKLIFGKKNLRCDLALIVYTLP